MWRLLSIFASANHYVLAAKRWRIKSDFVRYKCRHTSFSQYRSLLLLSYGPGATVSHVMLWRGTASGNQTHPPCTRPQSVGKGSDIWTYSNVAVGCTGRELWWHLELRWCFPGELLDALSVGLRLLARCSQCSLSESGDAAVQTHPVFLFFHSDWDMKLFG